MEENNFTKSSPYVSLLKMIASTCKLPSEEMVNITKKTSVYYACKELLLFLESEERPGDEVCSILQNLWILKKEFIPVIKEYADNIKKELEGYTI